MFNRLMYTLCWTIYLAFHLNSYHKSDLFVSSSPSSSSGSRRSIFGKLLKTHGIFVPKTPIRLLPKFGEVIDGSLRTKLFSWPKENTIEVKPIELTNFLKSIPHFTSATSAGLILESPHHTMHALKGSPGSSLHHKNNPSSPQNYQLVDIQGLNGYHGSDHQVDQPFSDGTYPETLTVSANSESSDDASFLKNSGLLRPVPMNADTSEDELRTMWKIKPAYQPIQFYEVQSHQSISPSPLSSSGSSSSKAQSMNAMNSNVPNRVKSNQNNGQPNSQRQQGLIHNSNGNNHAHQVIAHHVNIADVRPIFSGSENKPIIHPMIPCNPNLIPVAPTAKANTSSSGATTIRVPVPIPMMATIPVNNNQPSQTATYQHQQEQPNHSISKQTNVQNGERKPDFSSRNPPIIFYRPNDPDLAKVPKSQLFPIFIPDPSTYEVRPSQVTPSSSNNQQQVSLRTTYEPNKTTEPIATLTLATLTSTSSSNDIKAEPAPRKRPPVRPASHVLAIERESARSLATTKKRPTVHNYRHHMDPSSAMEYENSEETDNHRSVMPTPDALPSSDTDDIMENLDISSDGPFVPFSSYTMPNRGNDYNEMDEDSKSAASDPKGMEYRLPLDGSKIPKSRLSLTKSRPRPSSSMSLSSASSSSTSSSPSTLTSSSSKSLPSISTHISIYPSSDEVKANPEDSESTLREKSVSKADRKTFDKGYERSKHRLFEQKVEELWKEKKWNNIGKEEVETETQGKTTEKSIPWISRRRDRRRPLYMDKRPLKYSERGSYNRDDENKSSVLNDTKNVNLKHHNNSRFDDSEANDENSRKSELNDNKEDDGEDSGKYNWSVEAGSSGA